jgi:uncharacterized membrane protein YeaQ/YmgE (transglycosylase-associated protein family)
LPVTVLARQTEHSAEVELGKKQMDILFWIVVGLIAGWLASLVTGRGGYGIIGDIIVGLIGAVIGGFLFSLLGLGASGFIGSIIVAFVGAIVLILIVRAITGGFGYRRGRAF